MPIMPPKLALLTTSFPYGQGETFLETEIPFLAQRFQVEVVPTWVTSSALATCRSLPAGVIVRSDLARRFAYTLRNNIRNLFSSVGGWPSISRTVRSERHIIPHHWWAMKRFVYSAAQGLAVSTTLQKDPSLSRATVLYSYWLTNAALGVALAKRFGHPGFGVARAHRFELYMDVSNKRYQPFQAEMVNMLDWIAPISDDGRDYLHTIYPAHQAKISTCRLGVVGPGKPTALPAEKSLRIVTCSRLVPLKQIHLLVAALQHCTFPVFWTHLGGGPEEGAIRQQAASLPVHVTWEVTGTIQNKQVLQYYEEQPVDLFVNVSQIEGVPVSVMEAMSYSIPVYATDVGATKELVNEGNGRLLSPDVTPQQLAAELEQFFASPDDEKQAMRQSAWKTWNEKSNAAHQYTRFTDWLLQLVA